MVSKPNYKKTLRACYLGFITQAIAANFAPLLFLKLHTDYQIPLGFIALIPTAFFFTQLVVDIFCAKFVDKIGYRVSIVASEAFSALGLISLAFLPEMLSSAYAGIMISVVLYAVGSGLIEVLCSPIVEACPFENKEATMSLLHSFYCWGWLGVTLISTLLFTLFGIDNWKYVSCFWAIIPLYNIYNFSTCPIERLVDKGKGMTILQLFKSPLFWVAVVLMICSGASELSMAQWASAFVESGLGFSKTFCDLAGPCLFAVTMGISRVFYGQFGEKVDLMKFMVASGILCLLCYFLASFSSSSALALSGCVLCGFSVGIMLAWNPEHFFKKNSGWRNRYVRASGNGRRFRRLDWAQHGRDDFSKSRRQPAIRASFRWHLSCAADCVFAHSEKHGKR